MHRDYAFSANTGRWDVLVQYWTTVADGGSALNQLTNTNRTLQGQHAKHTHESYIIGTTCNTHTNRTLQGQQATLIHTSRTLQGQHETSHTRIVHYRENRQHSYTRIVHYRVSMKPHTHESYTTGRTGNTHTHE